MDYEIGSIADLISGSITPNRPKLTKRALTPVKHKLSPNVTPKSCSNVAKDEFLSPSIQKKKEVAKRTPKRIFQKIDGLPISRDINENVSTAVRNLSNNDSALTLNTSTIEAGELDSPRKKKKKEKNVIKNHETSELMDEISTENISNQENKSQKQKKKSKKHKQVSNKEESNENLSRMVKENDSTISELQDWSTKPESKKAKKRKLKESENNANNGSLAALVKGNELKTKNKKNGKKAKKSNISYDSFESESDHESDNDMVSETEQEFEDILKETVINKDGGDDSSDDDQNVEKKETETELKSSLAQKVRPFVIDETEVRRTLFVGNVPISKKIKKDIKKLFNKYGLIESVRIRTIPVQDMHTSPKIALLTNKIHPERSTVNVYVKFKDASSVEKALAENNTLMGNNHLRVTRSDSAGEYHDPRKTLFVGNLPFNMEDDALRGLFEKCGSIDSVRIIRDKKLQVGKGFGYVNFTNADGVELALNLSEEDLKIGNRVVRVKRYTLMGGKGKDKFPKYQTKRPGSHPGRGGFHQRSSGGQNQRSQQEQVGAFRRIQNKKQQQIPKGQWGDKQKTFEKRGKFGNDKSKEKKPKKDFAGLSAERKKPKNKFNKDEKKKRLLSEILTKRD